MNDSIAKMLDTIEIPKMVNVVQKFDTAHIEDPGAEMNKLLLNDPVVKGRIAGCRRIGITVGSRGIANLKEIVRSLCVYLKAEGITPFIIPSMGSHGGATGEGQIHVLAELGVTTEYTGAEMLSSMEVELLGTTEDGIPVYFDKLALGLDGVIVLNRVKAHTDLDGDIESGLQKMMTIGLGNHQGAQIIHAKGLDNAAERLKSVARYALKNSNILFGVALTENAYDKTCGIEIIDRDKITEREPEILKESRNKLPGFLFNDIDVLIVDYIGKNISGDGMDPNIIGRSMIGVKRKDIFINKIVTLDLTKETGTSGLGVGLSDVTTERIYKKIDLDIMYVNAITAIALKGANIPMVMDTDKHAIQLAMKATCKSDYKNLRVVRIKDTLSLSEIAVSEAIAEEIKDSPDVDIISEAYEMAFNKHNDLL